MKNKLIISIILLGTVTTALTSCNSVTLAIKAKGEEVSATSWSENYINSFEKNLDDFNNGIFSGYSISDKLGTLSSSFNLKYKKQTTSKNKTISVEEKNTLKSSTNNKENTVVTFDIDNNTYKQKVDKKSTKRTPQGIGFSDSNTSIQYQKYQNKVYAFDLVNKEYSEAPAATSTVPIAALSDSYLQKAYSTILEVYTLLKLMGDSFGKSDEYKNDKFYAKGNVLTIVRTKDYADTLSDISDYKNIEGTVTYTRQYILEKTYITVTKYTKYKSCAWEDNDGRYKYKMQQETGDTFTLKLKGSVSKVHVDDFTFKS